MKRALVLMTLLLSCKEKETSAQRASVGPGAPSIVASTPRPVKPRPACMEVAKAKANAEEQAGTAPSGGAPLKDADAVIATLRPRFKACYTEGQRVDPWMQGCVVLRTHVGAKGDVDKTEVFVREELSDPVVDCITDAVRSAKFVPPGGHGSVLQVPVTFVIPESEKK